MGVIIFLNLFFYSQLTLAKIKSQSGNQVKIMPQLFTRPFNNDETAGFRTEITIVFNTAVNNPPDLRVRTLLSQLTIVFSAAGVSVLKLGVGVIERPNIF